jgi:hypothetical protein
MQKYKLLQTKQIKTLTVIKKQHKQSKKQQ